MNTLYNEESFKQACWFSRNMFHYILQKVGPEILKEDTGVGSVSSDERLAITLYNLEKETITILLVRWPDMQSLLWLVYQRSLPTNCRDSARRKCYKVVSKTQRGLSSSSYWYGIKVAIQVCFCCNWRFTLTNKMATKGTRSNETVP